MKEKPIDISLEGEKGRSLQTSFLMANLEVFNWGPFQGKHSCEFDPRGTAIIGPTGSGKTTLVDALMTLLAPHPKYNLASTGGHESDRDLISYIRGVSGAESSEVENAHIARPGKVVTGLSTTYLSSTEMVSIGALFWVEGSSNAADDLKKIWFFAKDIGRPLDQLLLLHHEGGKLALTRHAKETVGLRLYSSKREYLAQLRSFFEVNENAFSLLNRAAGLKQINSIDQIFRELVLDDRSTFDRAQEVAAEFDILEGIYGELETARRQRDSLLPIQTHQNSLQEIQSELARRQNLKSLLPTWFAGVAVSLWQVEVANISAGLEETHSKLKFAEEETNRIEIRVNMLNDVYLQLGGAMVSEIEGNIATKERLADGIRKKSESYQHFLEKIGLDNELSAATFQKTISLLSERSVSMREALNKAHASTLPTENQLRANNLAAKALEDEIAAVKARPHSNISPRYQAFRELLATHLEVSAIDLPFIAELIEVKAEESQWRGAIERAIGSERLRILILDRYMTDALSWINNRDNELHVRLQSVGALSSPPRFLNDGYTTKLNYRDHPFKENVKHQLSKRDRHCVKSIQELKGIEFGMTVQGAMSDRGGKFEKQDQIPLNTGWVTGFDNSHQLKSLAKQLDKIRLDIQRLQKEFRKLQGEEEILRQYLIIVDQIQTLEFHEIDLPGIERELNEQRGRLAALTNPNSNFARAKLDYENAQSELDDLRSGSGELREMLGGFKTALQNALAELQKVGDLCGEGLNEIDTALAAAAFPIPASIAVRNLVNIERAALREIEEAIEHEEQLKADCEKKLVRAMEAAKREDRGSLADVKTELYDVSEYLNRITILQEEGLPEKLKRFLDYLNHSSGQGVTQLLAHIANEVAMIVERIDDLNATLSRVEFRAGQYLQLHPEIISHESLRQIETAHRKLCQAALKVEDDQGASHYHALGEVIRILREAADNRRTLAAQALLDPRHRLRFFVYEVDRSTGQFSGRRAGSQTGSGGEKEMMASYILTASLSYALCPTGATQPRYATIILDEAFSKSSPAAASRIIEALRIFGLHPLFVTPNKEISLLRANTNSAILVHNKNKRATITSLTWEQIQAHERNPAEGNENHR